VIAWLKGLSGVVILGAIVAAVMMVLRAMSAGKLEAKVKENEQRVTELNNGTEADIETARKLQNSIDFKKEKARAIRKKSEASLERIGQDETMADIADRFNNKSGRVRKRSDTAT
jgi:flagellar biosynthesis/type III secretory pathway M-ring protein FliF/YscJ